MYDNPYGYGYTGGTVSKVSTATDTEKNQRSSKKLPLKWSSVQWNPPQHRAASGAYVANYKNVAGNKRQFFGAGNDTGRLQVLGPNKATTRHHLKGVIYQHLANVNTEWKVQPATGGEYSDGTALDGARYGFRFHYNPSSIDFGMGVNLGLVNPAIIMSGAGQSTPITSQNMPSITFQIFLNRIDDMMLMGSAGRGGKTPSGVVKPSREDMNYFYGRELGDEEIDGIWNRGTGYDLEYLFRTMLGRPWDTLLRGKSADVGIAFGVPLILDFSAEAKPFTTDHGMRFLGRVDSISYSHLSFNRRMVPLWTQVGITFTRYPDVLGAMATNKNGGSGSGRDTTYSVTSNPSGPRSVVYAENWPHAGIPASSGPISADAAERLYVGSDFDNGTYGGGNF